MMNGGSPGIKFRSKTLDFVSSIFEVHYCKTFQSNLCDVHLHQ